MGMCVSSSAAETTKRMLDILEFNQVFVSMSCSRVCHGTWTQVLCQSSWPSWPRVISSAPLNSFMTEMFFYIYYGIYHLLHDFKSKIHFLFWIYKIRCHDWLLCLFIGLIYLLAVVSRKFFRFLWPSRQTKGELRRFFEMWFLFQIAF